MPSAITNTYQVASDLALDVTADAVSIRAGKNMDEPLLKLDHGEARELAETILADLADRYGPDPWEARADEERFL